MTPIPDHDPMRALAPWEDEYKELWLALLPRDAVHVRDGRTFASGAGGAARTRQPWPSTVAGAVGAAIRDTGGAVEPRTVRGPFLARRRVGGGAWQLHLPVPADLVPEKDDPKVWHRLRPGADDRDGVVTDLDRRAPGLRPPTAEYAGTADEGLWWEAPLLERYLHGEQHEDDELIHAARPLVTEFRTGIAIRERRVLPSHMYTTEFLRLRGSGTGNGAHWEWAFMALAECTRDSTPPLAHPVRLGGAGRIADLEVYQEANPPSLPEPPSRYPGGKVLVYLATPAIWRNQDENGSWRNTWCPQLPDGAELVSATVNGPQHVARSGVDRQGEPEYSWLQWAVPAGSVYLLQFSGAAPEARESAAKTWATRAHGRAWGEDTSNDDADGRRLATAGFGLILTGTWM